MVIHLLSELEHPAQTIELDPSLSIFGLSYSPYGISIRDVVRDEHVLPSRFTLLSGKLAPPSDAGTPVEESIPDTGNSDELDSNLLLPPDELMSGEVSPASEEPPSGSGLTPPTSPQFKRQPLKPTRSSSLITASSALKVPFSSVIAETLLIGRRDVQGLVPTPIVLRLACLCDEKRNEEAISLVDEERRRGRRGEVGEDKVGL